MISSFWKNVDFLSVGLFILAFILVILKLFKKKKPLNTIPGPTRWSALWNLSDMRRDSRHMHEILTDWAKQYGNIMSLGKVGTVVLSDWHVVKEALLKQPDVFCDRSVLPILEKMGGAAGSFVFDSGETAKIYRRFGFNALRSLGVGKRSIETKINEELRYLIECFSSQESRPFDPSPVVHNAMSNIICAIVFGYRFDYDDERFQRMLRTLTYLFDSAGVNAIGNWLPPLINTPWYSYRRREVKAIHDFILEILKEHHANYDPNDLRDFIDMYIAEIKQGEDETGTGAFREDTALIGIRDLFSAGTDTSFNAVLWMIMCAIAYPEVQVKIQKEISNVVGDDRQPSCEDRLKMPYTNAFIMEMQRWRPVAPITVPYKTSRETRLLGYTISKGTEVLVNLWAVMHDPKIWERPDEFDPSRFLTADGQKVITPEAFIPFSIGRRNCLGEGLAKMELFLVVTNLFQRFNFKLPSGRPRPEMVGTCGITYNPAPFEVCVVKR